MPIEDVNLQFYLVIVLTSTCNSHICESICSQNTTHHHIHPSNWVGAAALSSRSSQSAELRAECSHMSYLGLLFVVFFFFPLPRVKIHETGGRGHNKPRVMLGQAKRAVLLKGQAHICFPSSEKQYRTISRNDEKAVLNLY